MTITKRIPRRSPAPGAVVANLERTARAALLAFFSVAGIVAGGGACVTPDTFLRGDGGTGTGMGGAVGVDSGGQTGLGGMTTGPTGGSNGGAGHAGLGGATGLGGAAGLGGRTGQGGATGQAGATGQGGGSVTGPVANFMDNFETGDVTTRWISDSPTNNALNPSSQPACGDWAVVADGATNHMFQQRASTCSSSNPSWAAGGDTRWTDMRLQAKVQFGAGTTTSTKITLAVRFTDDRTQYFIEYTNNGRFKIRSKTASSTSDVATLASNLAVPVAIGQWVTVGFAVSGSNLSVYLGEDRTAPPILTGTATGLTAGGIALGVSQGVASFDDILVTPP